MGVCVGVLLAAAGELARIATAATMTEKVPRIERLSNMNKPVPMKLFAAWEVDRTPPNCIPRLVNTAILSQFIKLNKWDV